MKADTTFNNRIKRAQVLIEKRVKDGKQKGYRETALRAHMWCKFIDEKILNDERGVSV